MEAKTTVSTAELRPLVSALKKEMQKKGYSPLSMRGLENSHSLLMNHRGLCEVAGRRTYMKSTEKEQNLSFPTTKHKLVIAEKPSVTMSIASIIGADKRKDSLKSHLSWLLFSII